MTDKLTELIHKEARLRRKSEALRHSGRDQEYREARVQLLNAQAELWAARKEREKEAA